MVLEDRAAGVVLEAGDRLTFAGLELTLEEDVSDQAPASRDRVDGENTGPRLLRSRPVAIEPSEQLVPAADGQHDSALCHRVSEGGAPGCEVRRDEPLLWIQPAADIEEIRISGRRGAETHRIARRPRCHAYSARPVSTARLPRSA